MTSADFGVKPADFGAKAADFGVKSADFGVPPLPDRPLTAAAGERPESEGTYGDNGDIGG